MVEVFDELQLSELVCSVVGLSALGAVTFLADTGDLTRFASAALWSNTLPWRQGRRAAEPIPAGPG
jgi:hypothetical protein